MNYIDQGGVIMYILLALNILGFSVMIYKFFRILFAKSKLNKLSNQIANKVAQITHHSHCNLQKMR